MEDAAIGYDYPDQLLEPLKQFYARSSAHPGRLPQMPPDWALKSVFAGAYHASLQTEESRQPKMRLVICRPEDIEHHNKRGVYKLRATSFLSPIEFSCDQLIKLAPVADPSKVLIAVGIYEDGDSNNRLRRSGGFLMAA